MTYRFKMEITQKLKDIRKEKTENDKLIKHYSEAHDTLKLEDIEYVILYSGLKYLLTPL